MGAAAPYIATAQAGVGLYGSYAQSQALKEQGKAEEKLAEQNARLKELQAEDAILRGKADAAEVKRRGRYVKGSQRAALAAQGVSVDTGSAAAVQNETDTMSGMDALTVQNNAFREAWGYRSEASNERFRGRMERLKSRNEARMTLLTGGLQASRDIMQGFYLNNNYKNTKFTPKNPTEARFDREYRSRR